MKRIIGTLSGLLFSMAAFGGTTSITKSATVKHAAEYLTLTATVNAKCYDTAKAAGEGANVLVNQIKDIADKAIKAEAATSVKLPVSGPNPEVDGGEIDWDAPTKANSNTGETDRCGGWKTNYTVTINLATTEAIKNLRASILDVQKANRDNASAAKAGSWAIVSKAVPHLTPETRSANEEAAEAKAFTLVNKQLASIRKACGEIRDVKYSSVSVMPQQAQPRFEARAMSMAPSEGADNTQEVELTLKQVPVTVTVTVEYAFESGLVGECKIPSSK